MDEEVKKKTDGGDYGGTRKEEKESTAVWSFDKHPLQVKGRRRGTRERKRRRRRRRTEETLTNSRKSKTVGRQEGGKREAKRGNS